MAPYLDWFRPSWRTTCTVEPGRRRPAIRLGCTRIRSPTNLSTNVDTAVQLYLSQGVDPSKIVLGSPMYGRSWQGVPDGGTHGLNQVGTGAGFGTYEAGVVDYWQIVDLTKQQPDMYHVCWDDKAKVPTIYSPINGGNVHHL